MFRWFFYIIFDEIFLKIYYYFCLFLTYVFNVIEFFGDLCYFLVLKYSDIVFMGYKFVFNYLRRYDILF